MRSALWEIWFNRDYTRYAAVTGDGSLTLATWSPADLLRMYIRKDVAARIWEYGVEPVEKMPKGGPLRGQYHQPGPGSKVISMAGGQTFSAPRGLAFAPDRQPVRGGFA